MPKQSVTRVERTFAFVYISGFTTFVDTFGDAAAVVALADFRLIVREVASHYGVRVDKWLGDGAMFVCVEIEPVVRALLEISDRLQAIGFPLSLRSGLASGMVILFEADDYIGGPVNLASRLCNEAGSGEILVTEAVAESLGGDVAKEDFGMIEVRGFASPVRVISVSRAEVSAVGATGATKPFAS